MSDAKTDTLAGRLAYARALRKLSGAELARRTGMSKAYLSEIERGTSTNIGSEQLVKLCRALSVSADWLLGLPHCALDKFSADAALMERLAVLEGRLAAIRGLAEAS